MEPQNIVTLARDFAIAQHNARNCNYDGKPYEVHLAQVDFASRYLHVLDADADIALAAAWTHDVLEDTTVTHSDLVGGVRAIQ